MADLPTTDAAAQTAELAQLQAEVARLRAEAAQLQAQGPATPAAPHKAATVGRGAPPNAPPAPPATPPAPHKAATVGRGAAPTAPPAPAAPPATAIDEHRWISRRSVQTLGSFSVSMAFHFVLLLTLALWLIPSVMEAELEVLTASYERPQEQLNQVLPEETDPSQQLSLTSSSAAMVSSVAMGGGTGHGSPLSGGTEPAIPRAVSAAMDGPQVTLNDLGMRGVSAEAIDLDAPEGAPGEPSAVVDSYEEAMDRITHEILMMLLKGPVLVMWCFDESESMKDDQKEIRERVYRVYEELGLTRAAKGDALLTSVGSYGEKVHIHTEKPTSDIDQIKAAIDKVPIDQTGKEIMCPAVGETIRMHSKFARSGRRQLALILVTDESGEEADNVANLEAAIAEARSARCPIYTLGREAVFGYPYAFMNYTHENGFNYWLQISRGPETAFPEQLQTNGFYRRYDAHPSGFGPFEQTRMARESGGIFFLLPSPEVNLVGRDNRKYELDAMRPYLPDLGPRDAYARGRDASDLRRTLWKIITDLNPYNPQVQPHIEMRHSFSIKPQDFLVQAAQEHERAKQYFLYLDAAVKDLERLKDRRANEPNPRWQANYDLIHAQILAYQVRLYEYGAFLEQFVQRPKPIKNPYGALKLTTHWELTTRTETLTGDLTRATIERSTRMLQDVIRYHAGTPWAARAEWELARGFGVDLVEDFDDPRRYYGGLKLPNL